MIIPSLNISINQKGVQDIVEQPNVLQMAGQVASDIGQVQIIKEERDSKAFQIKAGSDLQLYGTQALEEARVEAKTPEEISSLFFDKFQKQKDLLLAEAPNNIAKRDFEDRFLQMRASFGDNAIRLQADEVQKTRMMALEDSLNKKANYVRNGGSYSDIMQLVQNDLADAATFTSPSELEKIKKQAFAQVKTSYVNNLFENDSPETISKLINNADFIKDLNPSAYNSIKNKLDGLKEKAEQLAEVRTSIENNQPLSNIKNKKISQAAKNKILKEYYDVEIDPLLQENNPEGINQIVKFTNASDKIPTEATAFVKQAYTSNDPQKRFYGYNLVNTLKQKRPDLFMAGARSGLNALTIEAQHYKTMVENGISESQIIQVLDNTYRKKDDMAIKQRIKDANNVIKDIELPDTDEFDYKATLFDADYPEDAFQAPYIQNMYKQLVKDNYVLSGDESVAKEQATQIMKQRVGVSRATGRAIVMEYPPERYYQIESDPAGEWLQDAIKDDLRASGYKYNVDDVTLISDELTREEVNAGQKPTYKVFYTKDGAYEDLGRIEFNLEKYKTKKKKQILLEGEQQYLDREGEVKYFFNKMSRALKDANN